MNLIMIDAEEIHITNFISQRSETKYLLGLYVTNMQMFWNKLILSFFNRLFL